MPNAETERAIFWWILLLSLICFWVVVGIIIYPLIRGPEANGDDYYDDTERNEWHPTPMLHERDMKGRPKIRYYYGKPYLYFEEPKPSAWKHDPIYKKFYDQERRSLGWDD
jgi:hypothetical protein